MEMQRGILRDTPCCNSLKIINNINSAVSNPNSNVAQREPPANPHVAMQSQRKNPLPVLSKGCLSVSFLRDMKLAQHGLQYRAAPLLLSVTSARHVWTVCRHMGRVLRKIKSPRPKPGEGGKVN